MAALKSKPDSIDEPIDLDYDDVAALIGSPKGTIYAWVARDEIPHYRLGPRHVRFRRSEILAWITARARGPRSGGAEAAS